MDAKPNEQVAKGFVYNDLNENGTKDSDESGIPGVFVSNGIDIVQTDDAGAYSISVSDDAIIFVIKPRNWMTPVNEHNLPRFFYLHKPNGYPDNYRFAGVEPTGRIRWKQWGELRSIIQIPIGPN